MFGTQESETGLLPGESDQYDALFDDEFDELVYQLTQAAMAEEVEDQDSSSRRLLLDDLDQIPPGPYLAAIVASAERSDLNGFDLVLVMKARERLVSHFQAGSMADAVEISYSAPGDSNSPAERIEEAFEYASDEIRAALTLTRRAAESRLSDASDLVERLPRIWEMLDQGLVDWARARVIINGTAHISELEARTIVDQIAERAPRLTTGQLRAWIGKLCIATDPEESEKRFENAVEERRLWIEPTVDGTGNVHLLGIPIDQAAAIGRRVNGYMISLKNDGNQRTRDQLRADILCDLILGTDLAGHNKRGHVDIRVDLTTLAGLDDNAAELLGMGPVIADVARKVVASQQKAEWRVTVTDDTGELILSDITRRRPTAAQIREIYALHPTCTFPGCQIPAEDCDLDHIIPWAKGGPTTTRNTGPKCRHDHILKDHGWLHRYEHGLDIWTSPMGHTYITSGQSP